MVAENGTLIAADDNSIEIMYRRRLCSKSAHLSGCLNLADTDLRYLRGINQVRSGLIRGQTHSRSPSERDGIGQGELKIKLWFWVANQ